MQDLEEEYLTSKEAAKILKVTPATVMNMIRRGQIRGKKVGSGGISSPWRIAKREIIKYLDLEEEESNVKVSI